MNPEQSVDGAVLAPSTVRPMPIEMRRWLKYQLEKARQPIPESDRKYPLRVMLYESNREMMEEWDKWIESLPSFDQPNDKILP